MKRHYPIQITVMPPIIPPLPFSAHAACLPLDVTAKNHSYSQLAPEVSRRGARCSAECLWGPLHRVGI